MFLYFIFYVFRYQTKGNGKKTDYETFTNTQKQTPVTKTILLCVLQYTRNFFVRKNNAGWSREQNICQSLQIKQIPLGYATNDRKWDCDVLHKQTKNCYINSGSFLLLTVACISHVSTTRQYSHGQQHVRKIPFKAVSLCWSVSDTGQQLLSLSQANAVDLHCVCRVPQHSWRLSGKTVIQSKT
jgi:hypothetical protein